MTIHRHSNQCVLRHFINDLLLLTDQATYPDFEAARSTRATTVHEADKKALMNHMHVRTVPAAMTLPTINTINTISQQRNLTSRTKLISFTAHKITVSNCTDYFWGIIIKIFPATIFSPQNVSGECVQYIGREDVV